MSLQGLERLLAPGSFSELHADRLAVSMDLWPRHILRLWEGKTPALALGVVWPKDIGELQATVAYAARAGIALVPYGAGSSVVGGATPDTDQLVVDMKRLQRVHAIDAEARTATAECGIMGELFERALERQGFTQGHSPSSIYTSTLGGWIAARGAGQFSSRYGKIEDQVLGGRIVCGDGSVLTLSATPWRSAALDAQIGNEGTLGLWAEATVRIHPLPAQRTFRGLSFPSLPQALGAARDWLVAGLSPVVVRIYDPFDSLLHRDTHGEHVPHDRGPSVLARVGAAFPRFLAGAADLFGQRCRCIVGLQGDPTVVERELGILLEVAAAHGAQDLGPGPGDSWYARRHAVSYRQSNALRAGVAVDTMEVACTWDRVLEVYQAVRKAGLSAGAQVLAHFSHVYLDGASIYFTYALKASLGEAGYERLWRSVLGAALESGGNVSHHHGIGRLKAPELRRALAGSYVDLQEARTAWDPAGILNPRSLESDEDQPVLPRLEPKSTSLVATAAPSDLLRDVEARLAKQGQSLGQVASLFPDATVIDAARRGWLVRKGPQLGLVEPLVMGVDGAGQSFRAAPRSAEGPALIAALLAHDLERVWLRTMPRADDLRQWRGSRIAMLSAAQKLGRDEALSTLATRVHGEGDAAWLTVAFTRDERGAARRDAVTALLGAPLLEMTPTPELGSMPSLVHGMWREVMTTPLSRYVLLACDGVGAVGFVPTGTDVGRLHVGEPASSPIAKIERSTEPAPKGASVGLRPAPSQGLRLADAEPQLENCTYCPKLCRFSCPTATSAGSESLTPRQLMLTANLERRGVQPLDADAALRLYSCVDCKGCGSFCDHGNDVAGTLAEARHELFTQERAPAPVRAVLDHLREHGRLPDRPTSDDPALLLESDGPDAPTWLFLGCQNERADFAYAQAAVELVRHREGKVHVASGPIACCGHPLWRWGDREGFAAHARAFLAQLGGARRLIVDDPGCAYAVRELYPQHGIEVVTLQSLAPATRLAPTDVPHDACFSTRHLGEPSLRESCEGGGAKGSVLEGKAGCCGGMLLPYYDAGLAESVAHDRLRDLTAAGGERIVTSSPTCRRRLRAAGAVVADYIQNTARTPAVGNK